MQRTSCAAGRFNLSILECKCTVAFRSSERHLVLIYPYWNVNTYNPQGLRILPKVLIYPYWNVNKFTISADTPRTLVLIYPYWNVNHCTHLLRTQDILRFNLPILECKFFRDKSPAVDRVVLIYPYWNVN